MMQVMRYTAPRRLRTQRLIQDSEFPESFLPSRIGMAATEAADEVLIEDRQLRHLMRELGLR